MTKAAAAAVLALAMPAAAQASELPAVPATDMEMGIAPAPEAEPSGLPAQEGAPPQAVVPAPATAEPVPADEPVPPAEIAPAPATEALEPAATDPPDAGLLDATLDRGGLEKPHADSARSRAREIPQERGGGQLPGYCNQRSNPQACYERATDRARDGLCGGEPGCEADFDASPCVAEPDSQACLDYIESRPCLADAASFECRLWNAARDSYCAIELTQLYCGGSGSPGPEPLGRPGGGPGPGTELIGLVDTGIGGRLALAGDRRRATRPSGRLARTGYAPGPALAVALGLLLAGAAARRFAARLG